MAINRRILLSGTAAAVAAPALIPSTVFGQDKVIRFSMPQDFTRIYTFVTSEYSQGQRDYFTLVNERVPSRTRST